MSIQTKEEKEISEAEKYIKFIDRPGSIEKIKTFEREFSEFTGKREVIEQRKGEKTFLFAWELFLVDRFVITYPLGGYGYSVVNPQKMTEYMELYKGLEDLEERREYRIKAEGNLVQKTAEEKANLMIQSGCKLLWNIRGNVLSEYFENEELQANLLLILTEYFENNPKKYWARRDVYQSFIPKGSREVTCSKVEGIIGIGQVIAKKSI